MKLNTVIWLVWLYGNALFSQVNQQDKEKLVENYYTKGIELRPLKKDSSYYYFDLAYDYSLDLNNYSDALHILNESIKTSGRHFDLKRYALYLDRIETILQNDSIKNQLDDLEYFEDRFVYEEGKYHYNLGDFNKAKPFFRKLYNIFSKREIKSLVSYELSNFVNSVNFLALIYMNTGKYDLSENYFKQSLSIVEKSKISKSKGLESATKRLLANFYIRVGKYTEATEMLRGILEVNKNSYYKNKNYRGNVITIYQRIANSLIQQDSLIGALKYLDESHTYTIEEDPFLRKSLLLYGDIYLELGQNKLAMESYQKALKSFKEYRQNKPHQDIAEVYGKIAEFHLKQKNYKEGLKTIRKAFNVAGTNINIKSDYKNPGADAVFSKRQLLQLLDVKLQLLQIAHSKTDDKQYLEAALSTNKDILNNFDVLKKEFESKLDKQFLAETAYPIFHRMLDATYMSYDENPSLETLRLALNIAEKNKDFILLEALRNAQATQYGNISSNVLEKEAQLRAEINFLEKELFKAGEGNAGFSESLFKVKQKYYSFLDTLKLNYPKYHKLKYQTSSIDLETIRQKLLVDSGALISYTLTDDYMYAIIVDKSKENILKIPFLDSDKRLIRDFYAQLSRPSISKDPEQDIQVLGRSLYDKILKQPLQGLDIENLTIIPDGELHYLPFDMLLKDEVYLLETVNVGYGNSVASLLELKQKEQESNGNVLAFAPSFRGLEQRTTERDFGKLLYNDDEVQQIKSYFETDIYSDSTATLGNFMSFAPNQNMIHLATHASANDEYPDYSYLAFTNTKDTTENSILYIKDLYNLSLHAEMVTLSACQTGIGKLQKGQGMLSLSKGFYYAGAKSLVNTLWKINDKSTVNLMNYFYEELSKGKTKAEALRNAKLKYLETTDDELLRHPYYWAAFVVSGDISPLQGTISLWWFLLLIPVLMLLARYLAKKKSV